MDADDKKLELQLQERFKLLPKVVQQAITSTDVEKRLRGLAESHNLHLDQWEALENEVMLALLGFKPAEELAENIESEVGVTKEMAASLAADISRTTFEPIRQELERQLEHPDAKAEQLSGEETARREILSNAEEKVAPLSVSAPTPAASSVNIPPPVVPATPPASPPMQKAVRAMPASGAYKPGEASHTRKDVHDDPYRESPV